MIEDDFYKKKTRELLDEIDNMRGPQDIGDWIIRAQTLLVFKAIKDHCEGKYSDGSQRQDNS